MDRGAGICPTMEGAAWEVLGAGLRGETSALVGGVRSWSVENAQDLADRFTTGESGQRFADRLAQQLEGASDGVLCLAAELLYIRDAPLHDMKASTKANRIGAILAAMSGAPHCPRHRGQGWTTATRSRAVRATTPGHPSISSGCVGSCSTGSSNPRRSSTRR